MSRLTQDWHNAEGVAPEMSNRLSSYHLQRAPALPSKKRDYCPSVPPAARSRPRPTGPPSLRSRRHTGSREKGADHGKKDTGEGGAQAEVIEPVAQRDRRRAARVEGQRLRRAQGRCRARRRQGGNGTNERRGGVRPPVPGARAGGAGVPGNRYDGLLVLDE